MIVHGLGSVYAGAAGAAFYSAVHFSKKIKFPELSELILSSVAMLGTYSSLEIGYEMLNNHEEHKLVIEQLVIIELGCLCLFYVSMKEFFSKMFSQSLAKVKP